MMLAIDPEDEEFVIRIGTIVDVLIIVGGMGSHITREQALTRLLEHVVMSYDSKETLLEAMIEISENSMVHYVDSRDDRIFFCDTVFGGAAYMMDCGEYRVFFHNKLNKVAPRGIAGETPDQLPQHSSTHPRHLPPAN